MSRSKEPILVSAISGEDSATGITRLAGVYCEWCDSRNAETAKSLLLKVMA